MEEEGEEERVLLAVLGDRPLEHWGKGGAGAGAGAGGDNC